MHELGAEFHRRMRGVIGEDPSTNPIAGFQNHQIKPAGMKLVPSGETGCSGGLTTTFSAVMDALRQVGVTQMDMPFTPGRVWQAIRDARAA